MSLFDRVRIGPQVAESVIVTTVWLPDLLAVWAAAGLLVVVALVELPEQAAKLTARPTAQATAMVLAEANRREAPCVTTSADRLVPSDELVIPCTTADSGRGITHRTSVGSRSRSRTRLPVRNTAVR